MAVLFSVLLLTASMARIVPNALDKDIKILEELLGICYVKDLIETNFVPTMLIEHQHRQSGWEPVDAGGDLSFYVEDQGGGLCSAVVVSRLMMMMMILIEKKENEKWILMRATCKPAAPVDVAKLTRCVGSLLFKTVPAYLASKESFSKVKSLDKTFKNERTMKKKCKPFKECLEDREVKSGGGPSWGGSKKPTDRPR
uniref:SFRICE_031951 n=1 Tax=Spodoptera frugiperda TaxID=7108 RepID=A0A2H1WVD4_SPOFR